jgi:tight adherence protein C
MPGPLNLVIFGSIVIVVLAMAYAFSGSSGVITERLTRLGNAPDRERVRATESEKSLSDTVLSWIATLVPAGKNRTTEPEPRLVRAGFRRPEAAAVLMASKGALIVTLVCLVFITGFYKNNPFVLFVVAVGLGYLLPDIFLGRLVKARQQTIRLALPDALDLLVICMEAGLGLDQALLYISQELKIAHPALCEEFDVLTAEMRVGRTRLDALRSLATRTGVDDLQALVATLIQTDRFGTSVAQSLRIHSDDLRTKRRQRAEELAAKTTVKMIIPLVFFIFPALFVVILGPAVITMIHTMGQLNR